MVPTKDISNRSESEEECEMYIDLHCYENMPSDCEEGEGYENMLSDCEEDEGYETDNSEEMYDNQENRWGVRYQL